MEHKDKKIFLVSSIYSVICDPSEQHRKMLAMLSHLIACPFGVISFTHQFSTTYITVQPHLWWEWMWLIWTPGTQLGYSSIWAVCQPVAREAWCWVRVIGRTQGRIYWQADIKVISILLFAQRRNANWSPQRSRIFWQCKSLINQEWINCRWTIIQHHISVFFQNLFTER